MSMLAACDPLSGGLREGSFFHRTKMAGGTRSKKAERKMLFLEVKSNTPKSTFISFVCNKMSQGAAKASWAALIHKIERVGRRSSYKEFHRQLSPSSLRVLKRK